MRIKHTLALGISFKNHARMGEGQSDLKQWFPLSTNVVSSNSFTVVDTSATNSAIRFYRLIQQA